MPFLENRGPVSGSTIPSIVMALQGIMHEGVNRKLVELIQSTTDSEGPDSSSAQALQSMLNANSEELLKKGREVFEQVATGKVLAMPLTLDEVTQLTIGHKVSNRAIGEYRVRMVASVVASMGSATEGEIGVALGVGSDECSKLLGKLMTSGQLKKEGARYVIV